MPTTIARMEPWTTYGVLPMTAQGSSPAPSRPPWSVALPAALLACQTSGAASPDREFALRADFLVGCGHSCMLLSLNCATGARAQAAERAGPAAALAHGGLAGRHLAHGGRQAAGALKCHPAYGVAS